MQRGRVTRAGDRVVPRHQVDLEVDRRRQRLVGLLAQQEAIGRRHQLPRRHRPDQPAECSGELQRLRADRHSLAAHVDQGHLEPASVTQVRHEEVTGIARSVGGEDRRLRPPAVGQGRHHPLSLQPVAQLGEHGLAQRHRQSRALAAGLRHRQRGGQSEDDQARHDARLVEAQARRRPGGSRQHDDRDQQQRQETQQHHAEHEQDDPERHRHHVAEHQDDGHREADQGHQDGRDEDLAAAGAGAPAVDLLLDVGVEPSPKGRDGVRHSRRISRG